MRVFFSLILICETGVHKQKETKRSWRYFFILVGCLKTMQSVRILALKGSILICKIRKLISWAVYQEKDFIKALSLSLSMPCLDAANVHD